MIPFRFLLPPNFRRPRPSGALGLETCRAPFSPTRSFALILIVFTISTGIGDDGNWREFIGQKLPQLTKWQSFPNADEISNQVFNVKLWDTYAHLNARIEKVEADGEWTRMTLLVGSAFEAPVDSDPRVDFHFARRLPFTPKQMVNREISIRCNQQGEIMLVEMGEILITHWRKGGNGKIQIRTIADPDLLSNLVDNDAVQNSKELSKIPTVEYTPDKLSLEPEPSIEHLFRTVLISREFGTLVAIVDEGPGSLELESLDLDSPIVENPWISIKEKGAGAFIPGNQKTGDPIFE
jgi:hypothetical protein